VNWALHAAGVTDDETRQGWTDEPPVTKPPESFGRDWHRVDRGHAGLSGAPLDAGDVLTLFPRTLVLAGSLVKKDRSGMISTGTPTLDITSTQ